MPTQSKRARSKRKRPRTHGGKLDLRLTPSAKQLLEAAAEMSHKSIKEFVLDSAVAAAKDALAERRVFKLNAEQWRAFMNALDAPPQRHARLERLLKESSVFD